MLPIDERSPVTQGIEETVHWQKSPFIQGFLTGVKGALLGAGAGSAVQAVRGKSIGAGALIGGLGTGVLAGIAKAIGQDLENVNREAAIRYHAHRIMDREPLFFMPPPTYMGRIFSRFHEAAHGIPRE